MNVTCFGDSNTYGYDPRSYLGSRYPAEFRWVDILEKKTGWTFYNNGENGREIPKYTTTAPEETDILIIMLGTNDLLQRRTPSQVSGHMLNFLQSLVIEGNGFY